MDIFYEIETLIRYGIRHNLITEDDKILITNQILEILDIDDFKIFTSEEIINIEENLKMIKYPTEIQIILPNCNIMKIVLSFV